MWKPVKRVALSAVYTMFSVPLSLSLSLSDRWMVVALIHWKNKTHWQRQRWTQNSSVADGSELQCIICVSSVWLYLCYYLTIHQPLPIQCELKQTHTKTGTHFLLLRHGNGSFKMFLFVFLNRFWSLWFTVPEGVGELLRPAFGGIRNRMCDVITDLLCLQE